MSSESAKQTYSKSSSTTKEILSGETFNPDKDIKYSKPKANASGGKSIGILNSVTNGATYVSTPLMMTWGASTFVDKKSGDKSYSLALQFPGEEYVTPAITRFRANIVKFEEKIKADALANQKEWFGKTTMTAEHVNLFWTPMLKYAKGENGAPDHSKNPTLGVKIPIWDGVWNVELFDPSSRKIFPDPTNEHTTPLDLIAKGSHVAIVLQCGGIWFANNMFGVTWKLFQAVIKPKVTLRGKCHIQLSNDDKKLVETQEIDDDTAVNDDTQVEDSDEEIEREDDSVVSAPAPKPIPVPEPAPAPAPAQVEQSQESEVSTKKIVKKVVRK